MPYPAVTSCFGLDGTKGSEMGFKLDALSGGVEIWVGSESWLLSSISPCLGVIVSGVGGLSAPAHNYMVSRYEVKA